ncbi:Ldh family oxidoreductase [Ancylobacter amanitiformis]|uniref:(2R)-3-sulfolactate dehydrogenase (NADP+) n=1 Tax=Ancylobacter amanitiformis TaxID=217069 RepID=A0ABU0LMX4_9HYPH|nr:Ldh family oxidoreductase [Ancylobacter amanitiformis]MDQ0510056.1 (2R)-3-sulfolactate dehydrogenase (NADP+) [Ancylobacter amanitiformis]
MSAFLSLTPDAAADFARAALAAVGASPAMAEALATATVRAEERGRASVGFAHLIDYVESLKAGRILGTAEPVISFPAPALIEVDVAGGIAQLGFDRAVRELSQRATDLGAASLALRGSFTTGELGDYALRLAEHGLVALAATNGPPLMSPPGVARAVYCTNPIAFAAPGAQGPALLVDQASSATAFVNIREAAARGEPIPAGWAVDGEGAPTQDAAAALDGHLLPFGGARGANIALIVEILAAGLTGANWSLDAPSFVAGTRGPGVGLFVLAIAPRGAATDLADRLSRQMERLAGLGVHIPGQAKLARQAPPGQLRLRAEVLARIAALAGIAAPT